MNTKKSKRATLHDLMRNGLTDQFLNPFDRIKELLDKGADPNQLDSSLMSPLGVLASLGDWHTQETAETAQLLMLAGANPLQEDVALAAIVREAEPSDGSNSHVATKVIEFILEKENTDTPLRGEDGENILHILCQRHPVALDDLYRRIGWGFKIKTPIPADLINALDDNGNTPLHAMWNEDSQIKDLLDAGMESNENIWYSVARMEEHGADVMLKNKKGETVIDLIVQRVNEGFPTDDDLLSNGKIWSEIEARHLLNLTAPAKKKFRTTKRL